METFAQALTAALKGMTIGDDQRSTLGSTSQRSRANAPSALGVPQERASDALRPTPTCYRYYEPRHYERDYPQADMTIEEHLSRKRVYDHGTLTAASRKPRAITAAQVELDSESEETDNGFQIERVEFESDYLTIDPKLPVPTVP